MMYAEAGRKKQNVNRQQTRAAETSMAEKVFRDFSGFKPRSYYNSSCTNSFVRL